MKFNHGFLLFCCSFVLVSGVFEKLSDASQYDQLTEDQKRVIQSGQQVVEFRDIPNEIWPRSIAYQRVEATPEETLAVIMDFDRQQEYVHRVAASVSHKTSNPAIQVVDYTLKVTDVMQAFFDPHYTLQERFMNMGKGSYQITWHLMKGKSLTKLDGKAWIEPLPGGATLLVYDNFLAPVANNFLMRKSLGSFPVVAAVKRGGGEALQSIVDRIQWEKTSNPALLEQEKEKLKDILAPTAAF